MLFSSFLSDLKTQLDSTTQTSEDNKSSIDSVREDIDALTQDQQLGPGSADFDEYIAGLIKGQILDLEDQGNVTSDALNHLSNTMQNELRAKQVQSSLDTNFLQCYLIVFRAGNNLTVRGLPSVL